MLRKVILGALLLLLCSVAHASDTDWSWELNPWDPVYFGTAASASDGFHAYDTPISGVQNTYIGVYHEHGVGGWTGDTGFYSADIRSPLALVPGSSYTWTFYLWAAPSYSYSFLEMRWGYNYPFPAFDKMEYRLTYVRAAEGVTGGLVPVGTSILLNEHCQGTRSFPAYRTTDGRTGYMFELTATVVPEPSSLAALGFGLLPLAGLVLRRRR